jgi:uncharacterized protein YndB with AHSA1/START domain
VADDEPIVREIFIDATPEEVFEFLTRSDKYVLWMGLSAQLDPRPGGIYEVDPNTRDIILGEFIEVVPSKRIVFTWGWKEPGHPIPAGSTRVHIELTPQNGGTFLRLVHHRVPGASRERHEMGWTHYLGRLNTVVAGGNPGPDPYAAASVRHG